MVDVDLPLQMSEVGFTLWYCLSGVSGGKLPLFAPSEMYVGAVRIKSDHFAASRKGVIGRLQLYDRIDTREREPRCGCRGGASRLG